MSDSFYTSVGVRDGQRLDFALHGPNDDPGGVIWYDDHDLSVEKDVWSVIVNPRVLIEETEIAGMRGLFTKKRRETVTEWEQVCRAAGTGETIDEAVWDAWDNLWEIFEERDLTMQVREDRADGFQDAIDDLPVGQLPDLREIYEFPDDEFTYANSREERDDE